MLVEQGAIGARCGRAWQRQWERCAGRLRPPFVPEQIDDSSLAEDMFFSL